MKKLFIVLLSALLLSGCSKITRQLDEEKYNAYLTYYQAIIEAENKPSSSSNFNVEVVVNKIDDYYRYDVIIDSPKIAMFDIKALAIVDGIYLEVDKENMMPSIGIMDDSSYNMVPGQIDYQSGYVEGINLSLASKDDNLKISVMIDWKDLSGINSHREFVSIFAQYVEPEAQSE